MPNAAPHRGQSQWSLIWREFRHRRLAIVAAAVLAVLVTLSVFAPFIAYDRPIAYRGVNRFAYNEALRTLRVLGREFARGEVAAERRDERLAAMDRQVELMSAHLPAESAAGLREVGASLQRLAAQAAQNADAQSELGRQLEELDREFHSGSVRLIAEWRFPVIASLSAFDLLLMTAVVLLVTWPLWDWVLRKLVSAGRQPVRSAIRWGVLVGLPIVCGLLWWLLVPSTIDRAPYKSGFLPEDSRAGRALIVYEEVVWPPVPYGLDEINLYAQLLPPVTDELLPSWLFAGNEVAADDPDDTEALKTPWDAPHWLGTDQLGRDLLCRMIWGGRVSLAVGIVAVSIYVTIGIIVGSIAGYFRGWADLLISRFIEIVICFPSFFLILTIIAFVGPSIFNIMVVIGLTGWTGVARLVRGEFLRLTEQEFVLAGRSLGYSPLRIIFRHILPNAMAPVLVAATFGIAGAILTESALSFLGLGITVPQPSWGSILATGRDYIFRAPWIIYFPGLAIFLTITSYNLVGEALRDAADPRLRGQNVRR